MWLKVSKKTVQYVLKTLRIKKKRILAIGCVVLLFSMSGCTPISLEETEPKVKTDTLDKGDGVVPVAENSTESVVSTEQKTSKKEILANRNIKRVDIFYDATLPMMGFADMAEGQSSTYERVMNLIASSATLVFPNAAFRNIRAEFETDSVNQMVCDETNVVAQLALPSFYLSQDMIYQPAYVKLEKDAGQTRGQRMNQFMESYYTLQGKQPPNEQGTTGPVAWAIEHADEDSITIVVSDLSELQTDENRLRQALSQKVFDQNMAAGFIGVISEFSGFVPLQMGRTIWVEWGDQPTGSKQNDIFYEADVKKAHIAYNIPMTISNEQRKSKERPFYIFCMGRTDSVVDYINGLQKEIQTSIPQAKIIAQIYESDYSNQQYVLSEHTYPSELQLDNVTIVESSRTENCIGKIEVGKSKQVDEQIRDGEIEARFVSFDVDYISKETDPRRGNFSAEDFDVSMKVYALTAEGERGEEISTDLYTHPEIQPKLTNQSDGVGITVRCYHPLQKLPRGDYEVEISMTVLQPKNEEVTAYFRNFSSESSQTVEDFDGSKTIGLKGFLDAMNTMQKNRMETILIGSFTYRLKILEK